jgi:DNA repair exonuclease SbcCD ATPase subunit
MLLKRLNISRFLGFKDKGLIYEDGVFSSGINVIFGSNGSGKSVTLKAIKGLLWPLFFKDIPSISLSSTWFCGKRDVDIGYEGDVHVISEEKLLGHLPPISKAASYFLSVDDLFNATDDKYALKMFNEAFGGYDLVSIKDNLEVKKVFAQRESIRLLKLEKEKKKNSQELVDYFVKKEALPKIAKELKEAKEAKELLLILEDFSLLKQLEHQRAQLDKKFEKFPYQLKFFKGDESLMLKKFNERKYDIDKKIEDLKGSIVIEEKRFSEVSSFVLKEEDRVCYQKRLDNFFKLLKEVENKRSERDKKRFILEEELRYLAISLEDFKNINIDKVNSICNLSQQLQDLLLLKRELLARYDILCGDGDGDGDGGSLKRILLLIEECKGYGKRIDIIWLLAVIGLISVFCKEYISFGLELLFLSSWLWLKHPKRMLIKELGRSIGNDEMDKIEKEADIALGGILRKQEEIVLKQEVKGRLEGLEKDVLALGDKLHSLCISCGFKKVLDVFLLKSFVETIQKVREFYLIFLQDNEEVNELERMLGEEERAIKLFFNRYGIDTDVSGMEYWFAKVVANASMRDKALMDKAKHEEGLAINLFEKDKLDKEFKELRSCCHVATDDDLEYCLKFFDEYRELGKERGELCVSIEFLTKKLGDIEFLKGMDADRMELEVKAKSYERLLEEYTTKKSEVNLIEKTSFLDDIKRRHDVAMKELEGKFLEACFLKVGSFLLNEAEDSFKSESQCRIFDIADGLFNKFTKGSYNLIAPRKGKQRMEFFAFDNIKSEVRGLEELSRGTRMQLIMAIRLAFMEDDKVKVPLFFDEALSSADDGRMESILGVLFDMAIGGRQIFYFTCKGSDVELLKRKAEELQYADMKVVSI